MIRLNMNRRSFWGKVKRRSGQRSSRVKEECTTGNINHRFIRMSLLDLHDFLKLLEVEFSISVFVVLSNAFADLVHAVVLLCKLDLSLCDEAILVLVNNLKGCQINICINLLLRSAERYCGWSCPCRISSWLVWSLPLRWSHPCSRQWSEKICLISLLQSNVDGLNLLEQEK